MFSSRYFMVSGLTFKSSVLFELIFVHGIRDKFHSFACGCSVFPTPFIEETILSLLCVICLFVVN